MPQLLTALPANYRQLLTAQHAAKTAPNLCVTCGARPGLPDFCPWCTPSVVPVEEPTEVLCACGTCLRLVDPADVRDVCDYCWDHCDDDRDLSVSSGNVDPWTTDATMPF